jgi:6-methylsalicylate decarboxylase
MPASPSSASPSLDVDDLLARGCVGISLPAGGLSTPDDLDHLEPVIARAAKLDAPLFFHPGPGLGRPSREPSLTEPVWWAAMTDYIAQMQAAWLMFAALGRRRYPRLRVLFALLAGGAPLVSERLGARTGWEPTLQGNATHLLQAKPGKRHTEPATVAE